MDKINLYVANNSNVEGLVKKYQEEIKHETLTKEIIYGAERKSYIDTNINGEHVDIDVEVENN